jgi:AmiR/NasT family two-component response regulator
VNKALGEFSARGWITLDGRKSLVISDSQRLASRARDAVLVADSSAADVVRRAAVVLGDRFGIDEPQALALLNRMSRDGNEPLADIAAKVVDREPTASSG